MKTPRGITSIAIALLLAPCVQIAFAADCYTGGPGCLDQTFGYPTGKVLTNTDGAVPENLDLDQAHGIAIQPDGKIVVAGMTTNPMNTQQNSFLVLRYNTDGSLDTGFGNGVGWVTTGFSPGSSDWGQAIALQPDGNIIVVGKSTTASRNTATTLIAVARYLPNGALDGTFGNGGKLTISFGSTKQTSDTEGRCVVIQSDGKIIVGGFAGSSGALARLNSNGSLDTSFGSGGRVTSSVSGSTESVAIQGDGKIVFGGQTNGGRKSNTDFAVTRLNATGTIDTSFGSNGIANADFGGANDRISSIKIDGSGNIVALGMTGTSLATDNFALARFLPNGQIDTTFGTGGKVMTDVFAYWDSGQAAAIQPDGKILATGYSYTSGSSLKGYLTLIRYNTNGTLDGTFGAGGIVTTEAGGPDNYGYALAIQADGMIVAAGTMSTTNTSDGAFVALARYFP